VVETQTALRMEDKLAETLREARGGILMYKDTRIICRFRVHFAPSVSLGLIVQDDRKSEEDGQQAAINRKWMDLESVDR